MGTETELKFSLVEERVPEPEELAAPLAAVGLALGTPSATVNQDRYYDDARMSLARAGYALRRRMADGALLATLKTLGAVEGALHRREEIEAPIEAGADPWNPWPAPIAERLVMVTDPRSLNGTFELTTERAQLPLLEGTRTVAVASVDAVAARRPNAERSVHWNELEIEASADLAPEEAEDVLRRAQEAFETILALVPTSHTKLERARALLMLGATLE